MSGDVTKEDFNEIKTAFTDFLTDFNTLRISVEGMRKDFTGLRKDFGDNLLLEHQLHDKVDERTRMLESRSTVDSVLVTDVKNHLMKWETKIPEIIHGAVKQCTDFAVADLKKHFEDHLNSDDPHPQVKKTKKEKQRERVILLVAFLGSGFTLFVLKIILNAMGVQV